MKAKSFAEKANKLTKKAKKALKGTKYKGLRKEGWEVAGILPYYKDDSLRLQVIFTDAREIFNDKTLFYKFNDDGLKLLD